MELHIVREQISYIKKFIMDIGSISFSLMWVLCLEPRNILIFKLCMILHCWVL